MDIKKIAPWNWFRKENEDSGHTIPEKSTKDKENRYSARSLSVLHDEVDRLCDDLFNGLGLPPSFPRSGMLEEITGGVLKPRLDLSATDEEYTVSVEIPGVSEKDVNLELVHDTLIIRGEKNQKKEKLLPARKILRVISAYFIAAGRCRQRQHKS